MNYVTVYTFDYPQQYAVVRTILEEEEIDHFFTNELTVQVQPMYSNAVGGIDLKVKEEDVERTLEILREQGYPVDKNTTSTITYLDKQTSKIIWLGKLPLPLRLILLFAVVMVIAGVLWWYFYGFSEPPVEVEQYHFIPFR